MYFIATYALGHVTSSCSCTRCITFGQRRRQFFKEKNITTILVTKQTWTNKSKRNSCKSRGVTFYMCHHLIYTQCNHMQIAIVLCWHFANVFFLRMEWKCSCRHPAPPLLIQVNNLVMCEATFCSSSGIFPFSRPLGVGHSGGTSELIPQLLWGLGC